jgi:hypothetical protein
MDRIGVNMIIDWLGSFGDIASKSSHHTSETPHLLKILLSYLKYSLNNSIKK